VKGEDSQLIDTLTRGIRERYSTIAEAFSSPGVSPVSHRQSPLLIFYSIWVLAFF